MVEVERVSEGVASGGGGGGAAARREQNRRDMRMAILDAAREIVDERGANKLTLRGIAQKLGYSAGAIYDYYSSKDEILEALYFKGTDGLGEQLQMVAASLSPETSTVDAVVQMGQTYRAYAHANVDLYWLAFSGIKERPEQNRSAEEVEDYQAFGFGPLIRVIEEGIANGTFIDTVEPMAIAVAAWSSVHGFVSLELSGHMAPEVLTGESPGPCRPSDDVQVHDELFTVLLRMVLYGFVRRSDS